MNSSKNVLIVLLNLSGSYKGGAQRRYLSLFNYLQNHNCTEYFLLMNDSLYEACFKDHILTDKKNVLCLPVRYGKKVQNKAKSHLSNGNGNTLTETVRKSDLYKFLGTISSLIRQIRSWLPYSFQLLNIIRKFNIGVIYGVFTGGVWSWQAAKLTKVRFIYSYNDSSTSTVERDILKILSSEYFSLKFADRVDFLSEGVFEKIKERGIKFNENKALFTPNSFILYDNFNPKYPKNNWIVFSARLTGIKNPQLLLDAVSILKAQGFNDYSLFFLGEGILLPELIRQKEELKLDNVFFEGGVKNAAEYLQQSKVFISIQKDNNYPSQSLLEAMACENAIIASDVGETRKLVTEDEGILIPLSAQKIADAIKFLLKNADECERLGRNARQKALGEHNIEKYSKYFFEITKS